MLVVFSIFFVIAVSLATPAPSAEKVANLTFSSLSGEFQKENRASWGLPDVLGSALVLGMVLAAYVYFTYWLT